MQSFDILGYALIQLPDLMFWFYDFVHDKLQSCCNTLRNKDGGAKSLPVPILASWLKNTIKDYEISSSTITNDLDKDLIMISVGDKKIQMKPIHTPQ